MVNKRGREGRVQGRGMLQKNFPLPSWVAVGGPSQAL